MREDTPHSSAVLSPRMSSLRLAGGGCLVVAFFRAPAAVRMLTLAALVAVASGSVGGEGDTSMTERQSEGEGGLRGSAVELQSRGDAGSNLTYTQGQDDQRRDCSCDRRFKIHVEFRVGSACAAGNATCACHDGLSPHNAACLGVPPPRACTLSSSVLSPSSLSNRKSARAQAHKTHVTKRTYVCMRIRADVYVNANLNFEHSCLRPSTLQFCEDPAFMQATKGGPKGVYKVQTCSTDQELMTPACDPARLNQEGREVDCWLDPKGEGEVKFHSVEARGGSVAAIVTWAIFTFCCCCSCFCGLADRRSS